MTPNVAFRADASTQIGSGHVMRCLTLAHELRDQGANCVFVSRDVEGNLLQLVERRGFAALRVPVGTAALEVRWGVDAAQTAQVISELGISLDCLVVDHYALDVQWEQQLRRLTKQLIVVDDLANRPHDCDVILDQNYYEDLDSRYDTLVPQACIKLLGPGHVLLREEFRAARDHARPRSGSVRRVLVFLGGSDPDNVTSLVIGACSRLRGAGFSLDVVVGASNPRAKEIAAMCSEISFATFHRQVDNIAELMLAADLAIGAGGVTTWERCILGLPTLTIVIAENQLRTTQDLAKLGVIRFLGCAGELDAMTIETALRGALQEPVQLQSMSRKALEFMSCVPAGARSEIASIILGRGRDAGH